MVHALAVHLSSYWEVGRAFEKLEKNSASPRATQRFLSCSPNFPCASITQGPRSNFEILMILVIVPGL